MTREEREQAISEFNSFKEHGYNHGYLPSSWSIEMAIQALEQSMPTMVYPQVDGITPTVVAQADGEKVFKMRDATPEEQKSVDDYIKSISKPTGINFWDLADGEYISKDTVIEWLKEKDIIKMVGQEKEARKQLDEFPSVAIPPDHDGCKDCVYQANPQDAMPCRECKHNYMDKFERAKVGHWKKYSSNWLCDYCNRLVSERSDYCPHCGAKMD